LTATIPQADAPISSAIAAQQAAWHCEQAVGYFVQSRSGSSAAKRSTARRRFIDDTRYALLTMSFDAFVAAFKKELANHSLGGGSSYTLTQERHAQALAEAEPIIRAIADELQGRTWSESGGVKNSTLARQLLQAAAALIGEAGGAVVTAIETSSVR